MTETMSGRDGETEGRRDGGTEGRRDENSGIFYSSISIHAGSYTSVMPVLSRLFSSLVMLSPQLSRL